MTNNSLSIHVDGGHIFYQNYNTGKNFNQFLLPQKNNQNAFVPK